MTPRPRCHSEAGYALVVAIWVTGLIAMMALAFGDTVRSHLRSVGATRDSAAAEALADAGVMLAVLDVVQATIEISHVRRFPLDRSRIVCTTEGGIIGVELSDVAGLVDISSGSERLIRSLLVGVGVNDAEALRLAASISDYRDTDDVTRPGGAEKSEYLAAGERSGPKNAPFSSKFELRQVLGMTKSIFQKLLPHITADSQLSGIDERAASRELLALLARGASEVPATASSQPNSEVANNGSLPPEFRSISTRRSFSVHVEAQSGSAWFARDATVDTRIGGDRAFRLLSWSHGTATNHLRGAENLPRGPC